MVVTDKNAIENVQLKPQLLFQWHSYGQVIGGSISGCLDIRGCRQVPLSTFPANWSNRQETLGPGVSKVQKLVSTLFSSGSSWLSQKLEISKARRRFHVPQRTFRTAFRLLATLQDSLLLCPCADSSPRSLAIFSACVSASFGRSARRAS